jgi:hypothetical protein
VCSSDLLLMTAAVDAPLPQFERLKSVRCPIIVQYDPKGPDMNRLLVTRAINAIVGGFACLMSIGPGALWAQGNPTSASVKRDYQGVRDYFIRAAEKMPEADYGFKPSPDVRSFGQQVAHVADDQYNLCAPAKGEVREAAYTEIEDTLSRKADLVPALKRLSRIAMALTTR